jgi:tyrosinase
MILGRGQSAKRRPYHYRLALERLEDRCLLSVPAAPVVGPFSPLPDLTPAPVHQHSLAPTSSTLPVPDPGPRDPYAATVRKDQSTLTDQERSDFVDAVLALKNRFEGGSTISVYDEFVNLHAAAMTTHFIHDGTVLFPWHRQLLDLFERELQTINPQVTIPYWNWAVDNQPTSSIWNDDFMGGNGDPTDNHVVKTGPFRQGQWILTRDGPDLRRDFGDWVSSLPTAQDEQVALTIPNYDVFPYDSGSDITQSFRNFMAGWNSPTIEPERHNRVHNWVGGSMLTEASPNDPVFWLVHANLDRIWADWETQHGYLYPESGAAEGENLYDQMPFLDVTPASVLNHYDLGYQYDTEQPGPPPPSPHSVHVPGTGPGRSLAVAGPVGKSAPVVVHAANLGLASLFHVHELEAGGAFAGNGGILLQAAAAGNSLLAGHAGHALAGAMAGPEFMQHLGPEAGHPGAPAGAHVGMTSVAHASAHPPG